MLIIATGGLRDLPPDRAPTLTLDGTADTMSLIKVLLPSPTLSGSLETP